MVSGMAQDGGLMNMASDKEKIITYELHIEDMLRVFNERFKELDENYNSLTEYESGRWTAYREILDIIKTRYKMIWEMFEDCEEDIK